MRVGVYTVDAFLFRKISLVLTGTCEVIAASDPSDVGGFDLVMVDCRDGQAASEYGRLIASGGVRILPDEEARAGDIPYPFSYDALIAFVRSHSAERGARLVLEGDREHVRLDGERIRLTDVEGKLLAAILDGGGEYVTRETLTERVWHGAATAGVLNVYIHYLREKLETRGEKIIISSRKCGYKIDARYTGGGAEC